MDLFYIVGILDERAHNTIGDAFFTFLVLFFGAFDCVLLSPPSERCCFKIRRPKWSGRPAIQAVLRSFRTSAYCLRCMPAVECHRRVFIEPEKGGPSNSKKHAP